MITTITCNPCIDRTIQVEKFLYGGTNRVTSVEKVIAGKGINVSRVAKNLGVRTLCLGFDYTGSGDMLYRALDGWRISHVLCRVPGEIRTNVKIFDEEKRVMSEFNEKGQPVSEEACLELMSCIEAHLAETDLLVVDGSVPQGVPTDFYRQIIELANRHSVRTILDASGELLLRGIEGKPFLIKPNLDELSRALGRSFSGREEIVEAAREILKKGVTYVAVSLGAEGALLVSDEEVLFAPPIDVEVRSVQGAGDALVAGFCLALENGLKGEDMLRYGMAAAAGSLITGSSECCGAEEFERFLPEVKLERL